MANLLTPTVITNWYLYGQGTTPTNLVDESLIRPANATSSTTQDVATFMSDGAGRFAIGSLFNLVQNFFAADSSGAYSFNLQPGSYTKAQLGALWGFKYYGLILRQQQLDDGRGDYAERAYIWNSGEFKISDNAIFVVDSSGNRTIQNFSVVPTGPDNFDFVSNDFFAGNFGKLLQGNVDPSGIGRTVTINFTGTVPSRTYDINSYNADLTYYSTWSSVPQVNLLSGIQAIEDTLWGNGTIQFISGNKPIIYGTTNPDTLSSISLVGHNYLGQYVKNGVVVLGGPGDDQMNGSPYDDTLIGGAGNDTFYAGKGNDFIDGGDFVNNMPVVGDGADTMDYSLAPGGVTIDLINQDSLKLKQTFITVANDGFGTPDVLHSIEVIKLSNQAANSVTVGPAGLAALQNLQEVDGGQHDAGVQDTLDLRPLGGGVKFQNNKIQGTNTKFNNFNVLKGGVNKINMILEGPDAASWQEVDFGNGNDTLESDVINLRVNFGNGNDTLLHAGAGSIINLGTGVDKIAISNDTLVSGATANDIIATADGHVEHGAVGSLNSESGWIVGPDGMRYGLDTQGDLLIKDALGNIMTITNYQGGYNVGLSQQTAGIFVGRAAVNAYRLLEPKPDTPFDNIGTTFEMGRALWFTESGFGGNQDGSGGSGDSGGSSGDSGGSSGGTGGSSGGTGGSSTGGMPGPAGGQDAAAGVLVLDLDGSGIRLTAESGAAPMFDMFGSGFAVHTGWVQPSTGLLVIQNADGSVSSIHNLVGGDGNVGFAALAKYDANGDGVIDAGDPIYSQLCVWQDSNGNGTVDPGELMTLPQAGIASINVAATAQAGMTIAGNQITATGTFTRTDGSTGAIADAAFATDAFNSHYRGNTTVSAAAAAMPNLKGYGTLRSLQVAMTLDPTLIDTVNVNLSNLSQIDLTALRTAAMPIFDGWAQAVPLPDANGDPHTLDPAADHSDVPILVTTDATGNTTVLDFAYAATDAGGNTYWKLASGNAVSDAQGNVIAEPTLADVMAQTPSSGTWEDFTADEIGFIERYTGQSLPIDQNVGDPSAVLSALTPLITSAWNAMNLDAVELAMQGPLAGFFQGLVFDAADDTFAPTTDQQLAPMYEAIFQAAPSDRAGAASWLAEWKPIIDVVLSNLDRGQGLAVSYAYVFASMVHAYETVGYPLDIVATAAALGVPSDMVVTGGSTLTGNGSPDIFYLDAGNQTVNASAGDDNFVMGENFGQDVINAVQGGTSIANALAPATRQTDILRFTSLTSTDVTASRSGEDLVIKVNGTDQQVTVTGQFIGNDPGLFGGDLNPVLGVGEVCMGRMRPLPGAAGLSTGRDPHCSLNLKMNRFQLSPHN